MSEESSLSEEVQDAISTDIKGGDKPSVIEIRDAQSDTAKVLAPQMGSDRLTLQKGIVDWRRFTNYPENQILATAWFLAKNAYQGGNFYHNFFGQYGNLRYSVDGEHKKIIVGYQKALSGTPTVKKDQKDSRNFIERHFTKRGQEPKGDEYYDI